MKMEKLKVSAATQKESEDAMEYARQKLIGASVGQLQAALCTLAEAYLELSADCPDEDTKRGLVAVFVAQTLDSHAGAEALQGDIPLEEMVPLSGASN